LHCSRPHGSNATPSTFVFEFFAGDKCYEYGFSVTSPKVVKEWLIEILKTTEKERFLAISSG
jgi:uncharacterized protein